MVDDESRNGRFRCRTVCFERISTGRVWEVSVTGSLERVGDRVSNPAGFDTSLPSLKATSHAVRVRPFFRVIQDFFWLAGACRSMLV